MRAGFPLRLCCALPCLDFVRIFPWLEIKRLLHRFQTSLIYKRLKGLEHNTPSTYCMYSLMAEAATTGSLSVTRVWYISVHTHTHTRTHAGRPVCHCERIMIGFSFIYYYFFPYLNFKGNKTDMQLCKWINVCHLGCWPAEVRPKCLKRTEWCCGSL